MSRKARATVFRVAFHALLTAVVAVYLLPLALVVLNSFKTYSEIMTDVTAMPQSWTLDNFRTVFTDMNYPAAFLNTLIITAAGVLGIVVFGSMAGYKLARVKTRYSKAVFFLCIMPMMIPFQSFMITLVKVAVTLHINSSVWGLSVIYWGLGAPMAIFLYQGFAKGIPTELEECALLDGASQFQLFTRIIFPMLKATTASVVVVNAMWLWNDFLLPLLMLGAGRRNKTLQLAAYSFMGQYKLEWNSIMAAAILIIIPALAIYLVFQKHIIKGMVTGAVKG